MLGGGLGLLAALAVSELIGPAGPTVSWGAGSPLVVALAAAVGAIVGWGLVTLPAVRRWFVPNRVLDGRSRVRAEAAFTEEAVYATPDGTGILLFLALFEHRCVVLADRASGRGRRAWAPGDREAIVRATCDEMRRGRPVEGVLAGIEACRRLLADGPSAASKDRTTSADSDGEADGGGPDEAAGDSGGPGGDLDDAPRVRDR